MGIILDHAGLVRPERAMASAYERATATAIGLKQLARRLNGLNPTPYSGMETTPAYIASVRA